MKIDTFYGEKWLGDYEFDAEYNLGDTCVEAYTLKSLVEFCGEEYQDFMEDLGNTVLDYGFVYGSREFREGVAALYKDISPEMVLPMHGGIGANSGVLLTLVEKGDNIVTTTPTYQQHRELPESIGAEVRLLEVSKEERYVPDLKELEKLVDTNTKMIIICNPNNPTGISIPDDTMKGIVKIAKKVDAYVFSDEIFRGVSEDGRYMTSIVDIYEKGIATGGTSKTLSLAGTRMGWIVTKDKEAFQKILERRDYDTVGCGIIDDKISALALKHAQKIFRRNREVLNTKREIGDEWVRNTPGVSYVRPSDGTVALVYYGKDIPSEEFCLGLLREKKVLVVPGKYFGAEGAVRIGYAKSKETIKKGLELFAEYLKEI